MGEFMKTLCLFSIFVSSSIYSQDFDLTLYFEYGVGQVSWLTYDYEYIEFGDSAFYDSSIVLTSFQGTLTVSIIDIYDNADTTQYSLLLSKKGVEVWKTLNDTMSIENVDTEFLDTVFVINSIDNIEGSGYIFGWIFPDTLVESVSDSLDPIPMYPYSKLYRFYYKDRDDSLYYSDDTLFIHYRPNNSNNSDSYCSVDYVMNVNFDVRSFSRYYSNSGEGFQEFYKFKYASYASIDDPDENSIIENIFLSQNYPNPFNPKTKIRFYVNKRLPVKLVVYDILGDEIVTLVDETKNQGNYEIEFDAANLSSGIYFYKLISGEIAITRKCIILK